MRYCQRCCYPENTKPNIIFDDEGVCSGCRAQEQRQDVDWELRRKKLGDFLKESKEKTQANDSPYDCIVPVGGGKDSHYQVYLLTEVFKLRPLLVAYNHGYNSSLGMQNLSNMVEQFGCDMIRFTTNTKTAKKLSLVNVELDLLVVGRETRPLPDAIAFTSQPFIEGLTWNRDACIAMLTNAKIQLKDGARWRVPADLTQDEKQAIIESISKFVQGENATQVMEELIGYTYTFPNEEKRSFLRDGREFSTMLNSCGRINKSGVGIAICMGDRNTMLQEGEKILSEYRSMIRDYMNVLSNERWRTNNMEDCVMVNAEGLVPETMTGTISSLIAGSPKNSGKIVILRTDGSEGTIKFSSRKSASCKNSINLSQLMRGGAEQFDGIGGGHEAAAGAKITKDKLDGFLDYLESNVTKMPDRNSNQ